MSNSTGIIKEKQIPALLLTPVSQTQPFSTLLALFFLTFLRDSVLYKESLPT